MCELPALPNSFSTIFDTMFPLLTVIIATFRERDWLRSTCHDLVQTKPPQAFFQVSEVSAGYRLQGRARKPTWQSDNVHRRLEDRVQVVAIRAHDLPNPGCLFLQLGRPREIEPCRRLIKLRRPATPNVMERSD
jgi:hypothetical protein